MSRRGRSAIALAFHTREPAAAHACVVRDPARRLPARSYRWRSCAGAYLSGVGLNALVPARGGDLLKLYLVRLRLPRVEDRDGGRDAARRDAPRHVHRPRALHLRVHPGRGAAVARPAAPPAFELSLAVRHPRAAGRSSRRSCCSGSCAAPRVTVARDFRERVRQGFTILRPPRRYAIQVAFPQALGWLCRVGTMFDIPRGVQHPADLRNALLVLVVGSISTLLPLYPRRRGDPAGADRGRARSGARLGAAVVLGRHAVHRHVANALLGFIALALMLRSLSLRKAIRDARAHHASDSQPRAS